MARFFADENFDYEIVEELRRLGHDVLTAQDAGRANLGIGDRDVLNFASQLGRAVLTFNHRHFRRFHLTGVPHEGIISCTRDDDRVALARRIHPAVQVLPTLTQMFVRVTRRSKP